MKRAFTLVEVLVALTIAGLIALAARATVVGGLDTQERLIRQTAAHAGETRFRTLVNQALRHMTEAPSSDVQPFVVHDTLHNDVRSHVLEFYSRGFGYPAGSGPVRHVSLRPSRDGLTLSVQSLEGRLISRGILPGLTTLHVTARTPAGEWLPTWPRTLQIPAAVAITFSDSPSRRTAATPIIVVSQLEPQL